MTEPPTLDERAELIRQGLAGKRGPLKDSAWTELERMRAARPAVADYRPEQLSDMIAGLPGPGQAFARLAVAAVLVRQAGRRSHGHLGFIAVGATGTGKTTLARVVCALFGLDPDGHRLRVPDQSRGALVGRHTSGGRYVPATWRGRPFVLFDEADKDRYLTGDALTYFQGDAVSMIDGQPYPIRSVPMIAANGGPGLIPQEYRRRSIVLDTSGFDRAQVQAFARQVGTGPAIIPLDMLPDDEPAPDVLTILDQLSDRLTDDGRAEYPGAEYLGPLVPAYAALFGIDQDTATDRVATDYLTCAGTVGQVPGTDLAAPEPTPAELAQERARAVRDRVTLAGARRQVQQAALAPVLAVLDDVLNLDRLAYLWPQVADLQGQGRQLWHEVADASVPDLQPNGPVYLAVFDWRGRVGQVIQPLNLAGGQISDDEPTADDPDVIDGEAWEEPEPIDPGPRPTLPDVRGMKPWEVIAAGLEYQRQLSTWNRLTASS